MKDTGKDGMKGKKYIRRNWAEFGKSQRKMKWLVN